MFLPLQSDRLQLTVIKQEDINLIHKALSDPEITKYYGVHFDTIDKTREQMLWYENLLETGTGVWWKATLITSSEFIGACGLNNITESSGLNAEIGCWLLTSFQRRGYASEMMQTILEYGFEVMGLTQVYGLSDPKNAAVEKLLKNLSFYYEGTSSEISQKTGLLEDLNVWAIIRQ